MRQVLTLMMASSLGLAIVVAACKGDGGGDQFQGDDAGGQTLPPGPSTQGDGGEEPVQIDPDATGLPCEVQELLENRCEICHATGAPVGSLVTFDDLKAKSTKDPAKTRAEVSLQLMKEKKMPVPPAEPAFDDEIAAMEAWIKDGMKANPKTCTPLTEGGTDDAGRPDGGGGDGGTCTSGTFAPNVNGELMRPGEPCIACHNLPASRGAPSFRFAGTVYPTLHEPNNCNGSPPPISVKITNNRGQSVTLPVNDAGNFSTTRRLGNPPYSVEVTSPKGTRKMQRTISRADCNLCHTQAGDGGAPGRILAP